MPTLNIEYVEKHGPVPKSELPANVTVGDKRRGLNKFTVSGNRGNGGLGGKLTAVYHIESNERPTVIRRFLEENPQLVDEKNKIGFQQLVGSHGNSWLKASREINDEFFDTPENHVDRESPTMSESQCSLCGEMVKHALADHLETECDGEL